MLTKTIIENYFISGKKEAVIFMIIGILAIVIAICGCLIAKNNFWKGMAIPLILFGCMELIVGYTVYKKCDPLRVENIYAYDMNPQQLKEKELPRIESLKTTFAVSLGIEVVLIVVGIVLIVSHIQGVDRHLLQGIGVGMVIQLIILLILSYIAMYKTGSYLDSLRGFLQ